MCITMIVQHTLYFRHTPLYFRHTPYVFATTPYIFATPPYTFATPPIFSPHTPYIFATHPYSPSTLTFTTHRKIRMRTSLRVDFRPSSSDASSTAVLATCTMCERSENYREEREE